MVREPLPTRPAPGLAARAHTHLRAGGRGGAEHKHPRSASAELGPWSAPSAARVAPVLSWSPWHRSTRYARLGTVCLRRPRSPGPIYTARIGAWALTAELFPRPSPRIRGRGAWCDPTRHRALAQPRETARKVLGTGNAPGDLGPLSVAQRPAPDTSSLKNPSLQYGLCDFWKPLLLKFCLGARFPPSL